LYDSQDEGLDGELHMRGKFCTDADGRYLVRTVRPVHYPIPSDGPVGRMLRAAGCHPWGAAHTQFVVSAEGYEPVTTHIFDRTGGAPRPTTPSPALRCGRAVRENLAPAKGAGSPLQFRLGRARPGHPRLRPAETKTWIRGSSPRKTN